MWVFTRYGFYSVGCASTGSRSVDPQTVVVRARLEAHLQNLQSHFPQLATAEIVALPERDYRYRLIVPKAVWVEVLAALAREQDWSHFKNEASRFQGLEGKRYVRALDRVWGLMRQLQAAEEPGGAQDSELVGSSTSDSNQPSANLSEAAKRLACVVRRVYDARRDELDKLKHYGAANWDQPDWIWEGLLGALSTMGNSAGFRLVSDRQFHDRIRYAALECMAPNGRHDTLVETVRDAGVRWPNLKAKWLDENFMRIQSDGGPQAVKRKLEATPGRDGKLAFLDRFRGIGDKFARDMLMDVYHPDFRDSIALDIRVRKVTQALNLKFKKYEDEEGFFLSAATCAGINGWEIDRVLYRFTKDILSALSQKEV
jgi:hypothetical protein